MKTSTHTNICESCGMPMHKLSDFGTNKDQTVNTEYCHSCYLKGKFVDYGISLEEKIEKNIDIAHKMGMTIEEATIMAHSTLPILRKMEGFEAGVVKYGT